MRGILFSDYHSFRDWNMILNGNVITLPEPKVYKISVDGRDGDIDMSEGLTGEIKYNNASAVFTFLLTEGTYSERQTIIDNIVKYVHGKNHKIITDDDIAHYYYGRCKVTDKRNGLAYGTITIECDLEPWRYSVAETIVTVNLTSTAQTISLYNSGVKTLIPELTVVGSATIIFDNHSNSLSDGTYKIVDLRLKTGATPITVSGSGTLKIVYREGSL